MLDWLTMDSDLRGSHYFTNSSNPLYTVVYTGGTSPKFYWLKGSAGYPWDINLYDSSFIYRWVTENEERMEQSLQLQESLHELQQAVRRSLRGGRVPRSGSFFFGRS